MEKRRDIFGVEPVLGDLIAFNPVKYKGLIFGSCVGFTSVGLPRLKITNIEKYSNYFDINGYITPKTGFVVHKNYDER